MSSSRDREVATHATEEPRSRRDMLRSGSTAVLAGLLGVLGISTATTARNGAPVRAGERTTATRPTTLESSKSPAFQVKVGGSGETVGLRGVAASPKGIGVQGQANAGKGPNVGVQGVSRSPEGIAGQFEASDGGTALEARSPKRKGVALRTEGKVQLTERSGVASVTGGAEFVIPVAGGLSEKSLVLATLQDHHPGIHVEAASVLDAEDGLIVVRLNQAVPEPTRVGWLVLD